MKCTRCGLDTARKGLCKTCKGEQGIIGEERLRSTYDILQGGFGDRKHGFTHDEANVSLPFNFEFTVKILEKLRNRGVLEYKNVRGSKRYYFTDQDLGGTKLGLRGKPCPSCGSPLPSNRMKICDTCRDKKYNENWRRVLPHFQDKTRIYRSEIKSILGVTDYELNANIIYWMNGGLIWDHKDGVTKYYTLVSDGLFNIYEYATVVKNSHQRRGFKVNIKTVEIVRAVKKALRTGCPYCHKTLKPPAPGSKDPDILTIDIMDPSGNLEVGNFHVTCRGCNILKGAQTHEQFIKGMEEEEMEHIEGVKIKGPGDSMGVVDDILKNEVKKPIGTTAEVAKKVVDEHFEEEKVVADNEEYRKQQAAIVEMDEKDSIFAELKIQPQGNRLKEVILNDALFANNQEEPIQLHIDLLKVIEEEGK